MAKSIKIPQFKGGGLTAQSTYRAPTPGQGAVKIIALHIQLSNIGT